MTTVPTAPKPLSGLKVIEVALGLSAVGAGAAGSLPGALLRDLGAEVVHVHPDRPSSLDTGIEYLRVWDRDKAEVTVDPDDHEAVESTVTELVRDADVLLLVGPETILEVAGLTFRELHTLNSRLVVARIRPSHNALGALPDLEILLAARSGLMTQIRAHQPGPAFADLTIASIGAALSATVGILARLYQRESTGVGGWAETTLADGMAAMLGMIIGRVENPSPATTLLWQNQGPAEGLAYACADGEYLQLWFGAKGAYEAFLEHMGDEPSEKGYQADLIGGLMTERSARWAATFATKDRAWWLESMAGKNFRCEPVLRPGEALADPHVRQIGLSAETEDPVLGPITVLGPIARVTPTGGVTPAGVTPAGVTPAGVTPTGVTPAGDAAAAAGGPAAEGSLLSGVRVLDLSAYLAGPITPYILGALGADVVKVEPIAGDVHRNMEPMFAAGQRGKRALALDLKSPDAASVLSRLFRWSDVVHHNARVGLSERLGYDEATVRAANPDAVYSFASGFGPQGPRASLPANDHLMQALSGVEASQGGAGQPPTFLVWGAIDTASGWVSACAILAGLYARRRSGAGQSVSTSLLGTALMMKSGAFLSGGKAVAGPVLDGDQRGYGAAYRIYQGSDDGWFALAIPDAEAWTRLVALLGVEGLPVQPPALRVEGGELQPEEKLLVAAFETGSAPAWVARLRVAGIPAELVAEVDRGGFISRLVDDPVNHQFGRVVRYEWGARGLLEQVAFPIRFGPHARSPERAAIPGLGEHTAEVLTEVGFSADEQADLARSGAIPA